MSKQALVACPLTNGVIGRYDEIATLVRRQARASIMNRAQSGTGSAVDAG
jgi:hypothetical protein